MLGGATSEEREQDAGGEETSLSFCAPYVKFSHVGLKSEESTCPGVWRSPHTSLSLPAAHTKAEQPEGKGGRGLGFNCENPGSSDWRALDPPPSGPRRGGLTFSWDFSWLGACPVG